ncbi:GNAT family N-acetyltransferase [Halocynthiibacter styelae]|uniref:GNAT family N-acetyltransferase n=1 Tax=Halocynthiibacter styelae TaxID=2761955 RepID=A0A8J7IC43_9RHOB|nr:GNAT family N-acetyltransferase [Paenihalocynthiibacter styelae]MBI1492284.1 GNAT family N-acetyltransferase [Paenihalocynthiibacter styelae]
MMYIEENGISYRRLTDVAPQDILDHMTDPKVAEHMPLLKTIWNLSTVRHFVAAKEARWTDDGIGHVGIYHKGKYIGWGGFQKEGSDWDFGMVLKTETRGIGPRICKTALKAAHAAGITAVTFLLPNSRKSTGALKRLGAEELKPVEYDGAQFRKFRVKTD